MESSTLEMKKAIGFCYKQLMAVIQGNDFWFFFDKNDYNEVAEKIFKKIEKNHDFFKLLIIRQKEYGPILVNNSERNSRQNLEKASDDELAQFWKQYDFDYKRVYSNYFAILGVEAYLLNYLSNYLFETFKDHELATDYFNQLTTEPKAMVSLHEKVDALKLALKIKNNKKWFGIFNLPEVRELVKEEKSLYKLIKKHENKWFWIARGYEGSVLGINDFILRIGEYLKLDQKKELENIKNKENQRKKELKKIKITEKLEPFFQVVRDGIQLKEIRKGFVSQSLHYFDPILKEVAKRGGISVYQAKFLKTSEIAELLRGKKNFSQILDNRIKLSVYFVKDGNAQIVVGKKAEKIFAEYCQIPEGIKELKGFAVSQGKVQGRVVIAYDTSDFNKIKKGDVVVTVNAEPSFSTAIIKAAALVTDGGTGVTSHPATLAREAGIPCVVDTKIATKFLADGDLVEVDGYKGIVKKID
jgi:phosphohistidine swiveling domain-containing protein